MPSAESIAANLQRFRSELDDRCMRLGLSAGKVTVVAVSKTKPAAIIDASVTAGVRDLGENRIQEAKEKIPHVRQTDALRWHLIGHLQTNKARDAVALFDLIHSVDRIDLAEALNKRAEAAGRRQEILIQVNTTAEAQKSGCNPDLACDLIGRVAAMTHLRVMGLMTIGPFTDDQSAIARSFAQLRRIFEEAAALDLHGGTMRHLSMGMSDDWPIALAEGANMLRIGRAIFGERP